MHATWSQSQSTTAAKEKTDAVTRMCVSYDRLLQLTSDIVWPPKMSQGLFTTGAVDNIDYNPISATARDSFMTLVSP